jgi:hypothetical protein
LTPKVPKTQIKRKVPIVIGKSLVVIALSVLIPSLANLSFGAATVESLLPRSPLPAGWKMIEGPKTFDRKTLFEHINGQAELFLKYGYQKSVFAIYQNGENREKQIEIDVYDMGNVLQAFGIFSRFRTEDRPGGFGLDSYLDERSALFYQGKYFALVQATEPDPDLLKEWAAALSKRIDPPLSPPKEIGYFPKTHLKPGSIQYFSESLLGLRFLPRGFQGTYLSGSGEFLLFLAVFGNPREAGKALAAYEDYLTSRGKILRDSLPAWGNSGFRGEDPYKGKIIGLQKGSHLLGAAGFQREKDAEDRMAEFLAKIR